jgi:hypothetical protein
LLPCAYGPETPVCIVFPNATLGGQHCQVLPICFSEMCLDIKKKKKATTEGSASKEGRPLKQHPKQDGRWGGAGSGPGKAYKCADGHLSAMPGGQEQKTPLITSTRGLSEWPGEHRWGGHPMSVWGYHGRASSLQDQGGHLSTPSKASTRGPPTAYLYCFCSSRGTKKPGK